MLPGWDAIRHQCEHIRSHQLDGEDGADLLRSAPDTLRHRLLGNKAADEYASEGLSMHPPLDSELLKIDSLAFRAAQCVAKLAAKIMPLHPARTRHVRLERPSPPDRHADLPDDRPPLLVASPPQDGLPDLIFRHDWFRIDGQMSSWRCISCGAVATPGTPLPPKDGVCKGKPIAIHDVGRGHRLIQYLPMPSCDMVPFFACELCHKTGRTKSSFSQECTASPTKSTTCAFRRLERGLHPHSRWGAAVCFRAGVYLRRHDG